MMEQAQDPPLVSFLVETIEHVEILEKELTHLPADAQCDRTVLLRAIEDLRRMIRRLVN